jgi:cytochrome c553
MKTNHHSTTPRVDDIDPTFEPWEPPRPIPIFLLAVLIALALAGVGIYLSDLAPWTDSGSPDTVASGPVAPVTPAVPTPIATQDAPELVHAGRGSVWSCASCHGDQGEGAGNTPRLAGLSKEYLAKQLRDFASDERINESMHYVARELSAHDIAEVTAYYANLPVPRLMLPHSDADMERGRLLFEKVTGNWTCLHASVATETRDKAWVSPSRPWLRNSPNTCSASWPPGKVVTGTTHRNP